MSSHYSLSAVSKGPATHPSLHIRDAHDAHILLEAVRLNILPLIKRRLTATEREHLRSGNIFIWEEADDDGGLLRWTDGRKWSQSRMRGDYLFYEEKVETTQEEKDAKAARRAHRAADPAAVVVNPNRRKDRPAKPDGLTKQTYSALAYLPGSTRPRRWHVVAYFSGNDYMQLPVIANYDYIRNIRVPEGIFTSSKASHSKTDPPSHYTDDSDSYERGDRIPAPVGGHFASIPRHHQHSTMSPSPLLSPRSPPMYSPGSPMPQSPTTNFHREHRLPPLVHSTNTIRPSQPGYAPLSPEDRRVLNKFRVIL